MRNLAMSFFMSVLASPLLAESHYCYEKTYSPEHMTGNPNQLVTEFYMAIENPALKSESNGITAVTSLRLRDRFTDFGSSLGCYPSENGEYECASFVDGGDDVALWLSDLGAPVLNARSQGFVVRARQQDIAINWFDVLDEGEDETIFKLEQVPFSRCRQYFNEHIYGFEGEYFEFQGRKVLGKSHSTVSYYDNVSWDGEWIRVDKGAIGVEWIDPEMGESTFEKQCYKPNAIHQKWLEMGVKGIAYLNEISYVDQPSESALIIDVLGEEEPKVYVFFGSCGNELDPVDDMGGQLNCGYVGDRDFRNQNIILDMDVVLGIVNKPVGALDLETWGLKGSVLMVPTEMEFCDESLQK